MNAVMLHRMAGMGALGEGDEWWRMLAQGGFNAFGQFMDAYKARGVARAGFNPYYTGADGGNFYPQQQLTPAQQAAFLQQYGGAPGSQISGGISQAWQQLAATIGVQPGTLTLLALAGGALWFMTPPRPRLR